MSNESIGHEDGEAEAKTVEKIKPRKHTRSVFSTTVYQKRFRRCGRCDRLNAIFLNLDGWIGCSIITSLSSSSDLSNAALL